MHRYNSNQVSQALIATWLPMANDVSRTPATNPSTGFGGPVFMARLKNELERQLDVTRFAEAQSRRVLAIKRVR